MAEMVGLSCVEVVGKTDYDLCWRGNAAELIAADKAVISHKKQIMKEEKFTLASGQEVILLSTKKPLIDNLGKIIGTCSISIDISKYKQTDKVLMEKRQSAENLAKNTLSNLAQIVACMPGSVFWKDKNGVYLGCNDEFAEMLGLSKSEIIGQSDYAFSKIYGSQEIATAFRKVDHEVITSGLPRLNVEEPPFQLANGKTINQLVNKVPLRDPENNIVGVIGIGIDITQRKKMEEELRIAEGLRIAKEKTDAANYIMTEFIANMGHDLAAPISDVGSVAQMLDCFADEYPEFKELFETLVKRAADCEEVRKRIINATSISNLEVRSEKFSILQVLLIIEKDFREALASKNLKLIIHPYKPKKEDFIETDREKLQAILVDLVSNAINFTEEGEITITILKQNGWFVIHVADTGIGIPSDKYDYIFEQYTKLSRSNKYGANFKGVGAGLYLARVRANILGATIKVESEVGKGSTFTLSVPVAPKINI